MTAAPPPLRHLSFLLPAPPPVADSRAALEAALGLVSLGEALGYTGAWLPWRGPDDAVWSAIALLAAATQHTRRIELGAHDVPVGDIGRHDLPAADLLSRGRFQLGLDDVDAPPVPPYPGSEGLEARIWVEAGDVDSARRAALAGRHLFSGSRLADDPSDDALAARARVVRAFAEADGQAGPRPRRIAVGRLVLPLDSADEATRDRLRDLASSAAAEPRGRQVPALVGSSDEIIEQLAADPALGPAGELRLELPQEVDTSVRAQILHDVAEYVAPELGWIPPSRPPADVTAAFI